MINESNALLNKPCRDLYHTLSGVLLETNDREFLQAYKTWNQNRKQRKNGRQFRETLAGGWLKRLK